MKRYVIILGFLSVMLAALGAGYLTLPSIAAWAVQSELADKGFPGAKLKIADIGLAQIDVRDFDLGPGTGVKAQRIAISYSPGRLASGVIDGVSFTAPTLALSVGVDGLDFEALEPFFSGKAGDGSSAPIQILGPIDITAGELRVSTPLGEVKASLDGNVLLTDGIGTNADFKFSLVHPEASVDGTLSGILDAANQVQLKLDIENATSAAHVAFSQLAGVVRIDGALPDALTGGASLVLDDVRVGGTALGNMDISGNVNGAAVNADLVLGGGNTGVSVALHAESDNVFDPGAELRLSGEMATDGLSGPLAMPLNVIGAMTFDVRGARGDVQALPAQLSKGSARATGTVTGWVDAQYLSFNLTDNDLGGSLNGRMDIRVNPRGWQVRPAAGLNFDLSVPVSGKIRRIEATLDTLPEIPFLVGGPSAADPLRVGMLFDGVVDDGFPFSGDLGGTVWPATTDGINVEELVARLDPWRMRLGRMDIDMQSVSLRLSGGEHDLALGIASEARFGGEPIPGLEISGGQISLVNRVSYDVDGIRLFADECIELRMNGIKHQGISLRPGPQRICETSDTKPIVHVVFADDGLKRIDVAAVIAAMEIALQGAGPYPLGGQLPRIEAAASYDVKRATWWSKLVTAGGNLKLEGPDASISAIDATVDLEGRETLLGARVDLR